MPDSGSCLQDDDSCSIDNDSSSLLHNPWAFICSSKNVSWLIPNYRFSSYTSSKTKLRPPGLFILWFLHGFFPDTTSPSPRVSSRLLLRFLEPLHVGRHNNEEDDACQIGFLTQAGDCSQIHDD